jgi:hypothetical protein
MKKFGIMAAVLVVGVSGVFFFLSNLNEIIRKIIEKQGSEVLNASVVVSDVDISLKNGRGTIGGLTIASPDGYGVKHAFTLGEIVIDMDLGSLQGEPLIIDEIRVSGPVVHAEFLESGASNVDELNKNVQKNATTGASQSGEQNSDDMKRILIKKFVFEKGTIEVDASALGLAKKSLDLPAVQLNDIGGAGGAMPDELTQAILTALTKKATQEIVRAGIDQKAKEMATDEAKKQAGSLLDKISK